MRGASTPKRLTTAMAQQVLEDAVTEAVRKGRLPQLVEGLLTGAERTMLAQRVFVARLLVAGWSYRKIRDWTGASPNTVATVDRWLKRENPRYRRLLTLQHRPRRTPTGASDTLQALPGSIKDLYRSLTGTALW